jgi:23S rRNA (cytosine1962-C5)-methyltransferase
MIQLKIKQKRIGPIKGYHPWVFSQAFCTIPEGLKPGDPVRLISEKGDFLAAGYFSSYSQITVRIWGYNEDENVDEEFFARRVKKAYRIRQAYLESTDTNAYRLINGESDLLPGLIVDKYAGCLVVQFHTKGIETWKNHIIKALQEIVRPDGIYERSDLAVRKMDPGRKTPDAADNLYNPTGTLLGSVPDLITIKENGFKFLVDVKHGQKTGFFLDQRDKRKALVKYTKNASVLNCFSYTGGFSVYALSGGAEKIVNIDTSEKALELARENIKLNGFSHNKCTFINEDVKSYLKNLNEQFDLIILDPPAFIKDRRKMNEGISGYKSINEMALRMLMEGGIMVTCSCSAHLRLDNFRFLLSETGGKVGKRLSFLEAYTHGIDHLQLFPFTEGEYLKCFFVYAE